MTPWWNRRVAIELHMRKAAGCLPCALVVKRHFLHCKSDLELVILGVYLLMHTTIYTHVQRNLSNLDQLGPSLKRFPHFGGWKIYYFYGILNI